MPHRLQGVHRERVPVRDRGYHTTLQSFLTAGGLCCSRVVLVVLVLLPVLCLIVLVRGFVLNILVLADRACLGFCLELSSTGTVFKHALLSFDGPARSQGRRFLHRRDVQVSGRLAVAGTES